jgi:hypothetical protein
METAAATIFDRPENSSLGQQGKTVEYRDGQGHTLAYLDYSEDGQTARCNVFDPSTSRSRQYEWRPVNRASTIVTNHLQRLGYQPGQLPETDVLESGLPGAMVTAALSAMAEDDGADVEPQQESIYADPAVRAAVAETVHAQQPAIIPDLTDVHAAAAAPAPAPEFASVADAADEILGMPEDEIVRHWTDVRGGIWQFHLRSICPPAETAAALREFVADVNSSPARGGRTMNSERRFYCWGPEGWNVGYAIILPA